MTKQEKEHALICEHCGAKMLKHWHRISEGLAVSLTKFRAEVIRTHTNKVHLVNDLKLTKIEYNNFQKLRYHGLVTKYINPETKLNIAGYWLLTHRGNLFCRGEIDIPFRIQTYRNKISERETRLINIKDILKDQDMPYWDSKTTMEWERCLPDTSDYEDFKTDEHGQMSIF